MEKMTLTWCLVAVLLVAEQFVDAAPTALQSSIPQHDVLPMRPQDDITRPSKRPSLEADLKSNCGANLCEAIISNGDCTVDVQCIIMARLHGYNIKL